MSEDNAMNDHDKLTDRDIGILRRFAVAGERQQRDKQRIAELEAQVRQLQAGMKWLREYAISGAIALRQGTDGGVLSRDEIRYLIGGIDGNIAVAMDRAKGHDDE